MPSDRSCGDRRCRISKDKKCRSCCLKTHWGFHCFANANFPKKTNNPNPSPIGNKFGLFLFGPSGENRTHGLWNPIVLLSKTQCTIRYCLDSVSLNFKCIIILFHFPIWVYSCCVRHEENRSESCRIVFPHMDVSRMRYGYCNII